MLPDRRKQAPGTVSTTAQVGFYPSMLARHVDFATIQSLGNLSVDGLVWQFGSFVRKVRPIQPQIGDKLRLAPHMLKCCQLLHTSTSGSRRGPQKPTVLTNARANQRPTCEHAGVAVFGDALFFIFLLSCWVVAKSSPEGDMHILTWWIPDPIWRVNQHGSAQTPFGTLLSLFHVIAICPHN